MTRPQPRPIGRGWATVDLERAERELRELIVAGSSFEDAARSGALGARCRRARGADGEWIVVLEPDSEGRVAGFLARNGEGWAARWERAADAATDRPDRSLEGPFGPERLAPNSPTTGPFRLILTAATIDA